RREERRFWNEFESARPRILGVLLDAVVLGLRNLPAVTLDGMPRMADFASWVSACEVGLGLDSGKFLRVYESNRADARNLALEASPLFEPLRVLASDGFTGTTAELLVRLNSAVSDGVRRSVRWPKAPNALANALRRMASNLRTAGIRVSSSRADVLGRRIISVASVRGISEKIVSDRQ
ncbi:MAG TPA: hypothetical protein VED85_02850, partial [Burkholderiaceae bacterium]|nr:hypothetical protein [Burkholderiaceae bacterium]